MWWGIEVLIADSDANGQSSAVLRGLPRFIVSQTPKPPTSTKSPLSPCQKELDALFVLLKIVD